MATSPEQEHDTMAKQYTIVSQAGAGPFAPGQVVTEDDIIQKAKADPSLWLGMTPSPIKLVEPPKPVAGSLAQAEAENVSARELIDKVKATSDRAELELVRSQEESRDKPRTTVIAAIDTQLESLGG